MSRHIPWLLGLILAPLMFGSVNPEGQAAVGFLFALSLLLLAPHGQRWSRSEVICLWVMAGIFLIGIVPLPRGLVGMLSPGRVALDTRFPIEPGQTLKWLTLSISPAGTMQRLWELCLVVAAFALGRRAATEHRGERMVSWFVGAGLILLAASEIWQRYRGHGVVLGLWQLTWGKGAGTFANPNHFANWLYVGALFCAGWAGRRVWPLQSARNRPAHRPRNYFDAVFLWFASGFAIVMAVASGSRGGFLAFLAGGAVWITLVLRRARGQRQRLVIAGIVAVALIATLAAGGFLIERLARARADSAQRFSKTDIWREAWRVFARFPVFGSGPGTFVTAVNHYKEAGGDTTIWHAENDYLQLLVETGVLGTAGVVLVVLSLLRLPLVQAWREQLDEPEVVFGALAALAAFAVHAGVDFVSQITATALLAAALLGLVVGMTRQSAGAVAVQPLTIERFLLALFFAVLLLAGSVGQATAFWLWRKALSQATSAPDYAAQRISVSLRVWPWASNRAIGLLRLRARGLKPAEYQRPSRAVKTMRAEINAALRRDPYNWELRGERVWFDLASHPDMARVTTEARELLLLNPLQTRLPLRLAQGFADRDASQAVEFLRLGDGSRPDLLREMLTTAWRLEDSTELLWALTPDTAPALGTLGDFAVANKLYPLAAQSFLRLSNRVDNLTLGAKLLEARRPDMVVALLGGAATNNPAKMLLARAHFERRDFGAALGMAEQIVAAHDPGRRIQSFPATRTDVAVARRLWEASPKDAKRALALAEAVYAGPALEHDPALFRRLASEFPRDTRLQWLASKVCGQAGEAESAARFAVETARLLLSARP